MNLRFRPLRREDLAALCRWHAAPHAAEWFADAPRDLAEAEVEFGPSIDGVDPARVHVVEDGAEAIGYFQYYPAEDGVAGIDFMIGEERYFGRGLAPRLISRYVDEVVVAEQPAVTRIISDPHPRNVRSTRALEKAGFRLEGSIYVLRRGGR